MRLLWISRLNLSSSNNVEQELSDLIIFIILPFLKQKIENDHDEQQQIMILSSLYRHVFSASSRLLDRITLRKTIIKGLLSS
jgi:hypothetical protein